MRMNRVNHLAYVFVLALAGFVLLSPSSVLAACSNPAGTEGELIYNDDYDVVQVCDGSDNWIKLGGASSQDDRIGTLTNGKWCSSDGSTIDCTQDAPAAAAAGSDTQVIFNDGGSTLAGATQLLWDKANNRLGVGSASAPNFTVDVSGTASTSKLNLKLVSGAAAPSGSAVAGGSAQQVQFHDGSGLAGDAGFIWDNAEKMLRIDRGTSSGTGSGLLITSDDATDGVNYSGAILRVYNTTNADNRAMVRLRKTDTSGSGSHYADFRVNNTGVMEFATGTSSSQLNNVRLGITSAGNVGVGTSAPIGNLHVKGSSWTPLTIEAATNDAVLQLVSGTPSSINDGWTMRIDQSDSNNLDFRYNNSNRFTVESGGDVGIGTTTPVTRLQIDGGTDASMSAHGSIVIGPVNAANLVIDNNEVMARNNGSGSQLYLNQDGGDLIIGANSSDYVGIGTNSPTQKLTVSGNVMITGNYYANGNLYLGQNNSATNVYGSTGAGNYLSLNASDASTDGARIILYGRTHASDGRILMDSTSPGGTSYVLYMRRLYGGNTYNTMIVRADGRTYFYGTNGSGNCYIDGDDPATSCTSDERLKKDIVTIPNALDRMVMLRGVTFNWKEEAKNDPNAKKYGIIAQELQAVFPDLVEEDEDGYLQARMDSLLPVMIEAFKDVKAKNDQLEAELSDLRARLDALEAAQ